jgi:hypothetical protein
MRCIFCHYRGGMFTVCPCCKAPVWTEAAKAEFDAALAKAKKGESDELVADSTSTRTGAI